MNHLMWKEWPQRSKVKRGGIALCNEARFVTSRSASAGEQGLRGEEKRTLRFCSVPGELFLFHTQHSIPKCSHILVF
jgi:hypothetical protein